MRTHIHTRGCNTKYNKNTKDKRRKTPAHFIIRGMNDFEANNVIDLKNNNVLSSLKTRICQFDCILH